MLIKHIGFIALCNGLPHDHTRRIDRVDLGSSRYMRLGITERFKDQKPYRVCKRCLRIISRREQP